MEALIQFCHHWILIFFLPCCVFLLKNTLQECWILVILLLFSLVSTSFFLLRRKSVALGFNIKLQLLKLKLWSPSWSGTLPVSYRSFLTNQTMSKYCDLDYLRMIRTFSSFLYEIEKFWFDFNLVKNSILYWTAKTISYSNYNSDQQIGRDFGRAFGLVF